MRGLVVSAVALLALAGCKSTEQRLAEADGFCQGLGARPGSDAYVQCRLVQQQRDDIRRREIAEGFKGVGDALQQSARNQAIANANRPLNCTSRNNGLGTVETTCN